VRRIVAAADVSALQADPQVQPLAAGGEAIDAAVDRGGQLRDPDVIEVGAGRHVDRPLSQDPLKGSRTRKVVRPGLESSVSEPLWRSTTIRRAVARPRPVPCPTSLVVKNESKIRSRSSAGMPGPSSLTSTTAQSPSR